MNFFIFLINSVSWDFRKGQTVGGKPIELKVTLTKEVMLMIDKKNRSTLPLHSFTANFAFNFGTNQHKINSNKIT